DDVMGAGKPQIEDRRADHVDSERGQLATDQLRVEPRRLGRRRGIGKGEGAEPGSRRRLSPMRGAQALYPAAFLVDQDWRIGPPHSLAQLSDERANLIRGI